MTRPAEAPEADASDQAVRCGIGSAAPLLLGVLLDGAGHHPAAWRDPGAPAAALLDPGYWVDLARLADRGSLDLVGFDDSFGPPRQPSGRTDRVRARLDAAMIAARVAPVTRHTGLVPVITTTHTEPFHVASVTSSLDHISRGRAGWQPRVSAWPPDAALVGARETPPPDAVFAEAAEAVEAVRRLWDSWEDGAIVRDVATGRFVDRDRLHYVDFAGAAFTVKGPSIVPRPPQGQPLVVVLAHVPPADQLAAEVADVVCVTPADLAAVPGRVAEIRAAESAAGRTGAPLRILGDLAVVLGATTADAEARRHRLDALDGEAWRTDAAVFAGTAGDLADLLVAGRDAGLDGWRLRPAVLPGDLAAIVDDVVPALRRRNARPGDGDDGPALLRERFGLARTASRYAGSAG